jgi:site-specific recombinase XerD
LARVGERKVNFLNAEEYRRLLDAPQKSPRDKAILELLFSTGMRVSELTSLNVGDINFERGEIAVLGKGKKVRVVFVSESSIESLVKYLLGRGCIGIDREGQEDKEDNMKVMILKGSEKLPLFLSSLGNRMNARGIERLVQKYAKVAGITKNVSPHTLRHTFATDLLIAGADIRSVQSLLGHSNISTTQVYTHVTDQHLRDIHKKFHNQKKN